MPSASTHRAMKTELTRIEKISRIVLALLVGSLIWGAAIGEEDFTMEVKLPVVLVTTDRYTILGDFNDSVMVKVSGSGLEMLNHQINSPLYEISKNVPVTGIASFPAAVTLRLDPSDIHLHGSLAISRLAPENISFTMDTIISRQLPVSVILKDGLPSRYSLVSAEPDHITIIGSSSILLLMDSVATEPVEISIGQTTASLAFNNDLVAYSEGSVRIQIYEPLVPVADVN